MIDSNSPEPSSPKTKETTNQVVKEAPTSQFNKTITSAVEIAKMRANIEEQINYGGLQPEQWEALYESELSKYPNLTSHKPIFDRVLHVALEDNKSLTKFWEDNVSKDDESLSAHSPKIKISRGSSVRKTFNKLFGFQPEYEAEMIKGSLNLRFIVGDEDFRRLHGQEDIHLGAFQTRFQEFNLSVIVIPKSQVENELALAHEIEHGKNDILDRARNSFLVDRLTNFPENIAGRIQRREKKDSLPEKRAKDEILAYFSMLALCDPYFSDDKARTEFVNKLKENLNMGLTKEYLSTYSSDHNMTEDEKQTFSKNVKAGVQAITGLYKFYRFEDHENNAATISLNVLEQFPLKSWSAVTLLIKGKSTNS